MQININGKWPWTFPGVTFDDRGRVGASEASRRTESGVPPAPSRRRCQSTGGISKAVFKESLSIRLDMSLVSRRGTRIIGANDRVPPWRCTPREMTDLLGLSRSDHYRDNSAFVELISRFSQSWLSSWVSVPNEKISHQTLLDLSHQHFRIRTERLVES